MIMETPTEPDPIDLDDPKPAGDNLEFDPAKPEPEDGSDSEGDEL